VRFALLLIAGCGRIGFDPSQQASLVAAWHFDEGTGDRTFDDAGSNEMLLHGASWGPRDPSVRQTGEFAFAASTSLEGLVWDGSSLWLSARNPSAIYQLAPSIGVASGSCTMANGCILGSFAPPGGFPEGLTLAADGSSLWHSDGGNQTFRIDPKAGLAAGSCTMANGCVLFSFATPTTGSFPETVAWDGTHLWLSHSAEDRIYKLDTNIATATGTCSVANGCVVGSFTAPFTYPEGLEWNGAELWHTDAEQLKLFLLDPGVGLDTGACTTTNGCVVREYPLPGGFTEDIAWDGATRLWLLDLGSRVYQFSNAPETQCKLGACLELDRHAQNDATFARASSIDTVADGLSIAVWVLPREVRDQTILQYGWDPAAREGIALRLRADGSVVFELANGAATQAVSAAPYARDEWMHIAATWDGRTMTCYVNGQQACAPQSFSGPVQLDAGSATLGSAGGVEQFFVGTVDELSVYAGALRADEIRVHAGL
jgi:hypothetical protein